MIFKTLSAFALVCALVAPSPLLADDVSENELADRMQAARLAEQRGKVMFDYDRAAWVATDRFVEQVGTNDPEIFAQRFPGIQGYIVVPGESDGLFETLFYAARPDGPVVVARYLIDDGEVIMGQLLDTTDAASMLLPYRNLIDARTAATEAFANRRLPMCYEVPFNTIILPAAENGSMEVYLLTPPIRDGAYPIGLHYLVTVEADGTVGEFKSFTNTCIAAMWQSEDMESKPVASFVTHILDDHPTEIHAFASRYMPVPLGVSAGGGIWMVTDGSIAGPVPFDELPLQN